MSKCNASDHSITNCPVCPMIAANVNLDCVLLKWNGKQMMQGMEFSLHAPPGVLEAYNTPILRGAVQRLISMTFAAYNLVKKQKIGEDADFEKPSCEFCFKRVDKKKWAFWFHTKTVEEQEKEEEDPC